MKSQAASHAPWERVDVLFYSWTDYLCDLSVVPFSHNEGSEARYRAAGKGRLGEEGCLGEMPRLFCLTLGSKEVSFWGSGS